MAKRGPSLFALTLDASKDNFRKCPGCSKYVHVSVQCSSKEVACKNLAAKRSAKSN